MPQKVIPFAESINAVTKIRPWLLNQDGRPNLSAVSRYCEEQGHPVPQPTLQRHYWPKPGKQRALSDPIAKALEAVFDVPARIWKGEPMTEDEAKALHQFDYPTILLAQKLEALPPKVRKTILEQIEQAHAQYEEMRRLTQNNPNVTPIERGKR